MATTETENDEPRAHNDEADDLVAGNCSDGAIEPPSPRGSRSKKKKKDGNTLRKAPQAPKRFKSSYILFFMAKQQEIKDELGESATVTEISKRSAQKWRNLPAEERAYWDGVATKDKQRYMAEKAAYTGPWQVPYKRAKKDPSAPKRPMSAFLYFSQDKRRLIKEENPEMKNTEISVRLGEMWRHAPEAERQPHIDREIREREKYKIEMAKWRKEHEAKLEAQRRAQEEQLRQFSNSNVPPAMLPNNDPSQAQQAPPMPQPPPVSYYDPSGMYQQQPSYMPPPGQQNGSYGYMPYSPPQGYPPMPMYAQYPPPHPGPQGSPNNGQPVILGPSGMPQNVLNPYGSPQSMTHQGHYPPPPPPQDYEEEVQQHHHNPYPYPMEGDYQSGYYQHQA
uniref:HMG box domain-containing protein n=1 Tax=Trieres chinensis TaxID=1514140 RepID=A0A7S2EU25_TRICV|mmetsp:Transcript_37852/g.77208  ORF Transcript_37852/g.77208 Transcript_37852/m.77208 type:complete len:392 (+) Transcript_37852:44-1219(+)